MKKLFLITLLLGFAMVFSIATTARAQINISIGIPLPPPIIFAAPPDVIVMPDTDNVYVAPEVDVDLFFWNGFWWQLWDGRWYRSSYYNRGWGYYGEIPGFYFDVDPGWRGFYRNHDWYGHRWDYQRIPNRQLKQNWKSWQSDLHWERQGTWGVKGYQPKPQQQKQQLRQQRQEQYKQRPDVQKQQHEAQQPQKHEQQPQVQQPKQPQVQQPQKREQQPQVQQPKQPQVQQPKQREQQPRDQNPQMQKQQQPKGQQQPKDQQPQQQNKEKDQQQKHPKSQDKQDEGKQDEKQR